ncbi:tyrosine-type recombinase/integrase [Geomonas sp. Red276]
MSKKFPFTKRAVEILPAHDPASPSREAEYSDAECIGLHLRVGKSGRRFFQHRYTFLGRKKCMALGEFPAVTVQEARQRVAENKAALARDRDPAGERRKARAELTFADFAENNYLPFARDRKKTWDDDAWRIAQILNPAIGGLRLSAVTQRDLLQVLATEKARTSAISANHLLALAKRMLGLAVEWEMLEKNPAANIEKFKEPPQRERYLTDEEIPRVLAALEEEKGSLSVAAIRLLLYTGCRRGEVVSLKWDQVNLAEGKLLLRTSKNGRSRWVHLNATARGILEELDDRRGMDERTTGTDYVFPSRKGSKLPHLFDLRVPFGKALQAAGIEDFRVHDLRHSFASIAVRAGASLFEVQKLLGHQDIAMTLRYAHLAADDLKAATEKVSNALGQSAA